MSSIKAKWRNYEFIPEEAAPDSRGIRFGDAGFLLLCKEWKEGRNPRGFTVRDTKGKPGVSGSVTIDWKGFKEALWKEEAKHPTRPSIFWADWQCSGMSKSDFVRKQILWSVIRAYSSPGDLAMDILELLGHGPREDTESFRSSVHRQQPMIVFFEPQVPVQASPPQSPSPQNG